MIKSIRAKKALAIFFLSLLTTETLLPLRSMALTSGPTQPEHAQFTPYSSNDMVDLFTGAFKYNIPVMDVDGYPVNLSYASGVGMDDEASWVGLGWNLNVGAITRQLRGVPDDFSGDTVKTFHDVAPRYVYGGRGMVRLELKGLDVAKVSGSLSLGVFSDSYTGMGAEFGVNAGISAGLVNSGMLTGSLDAGINSNTSSGVTVSSGLSIDLLASQNMAASVGVSANLGYNTREGLKELTLGESFGVGKLQLTAGRTYMYNTPPFNPKINFGYRSTSQTYTLSVGGTAFTVFGGASLTGYFSKQEMLSANHLNPEFGYLYAHRGTGIKESISDFMREKENPVIRNLPNIAVPIATPDVFNYTSQAGSGQFRLQRGNTGVVFDPYAADESDNSSFGQDLGFGAYFHGGTTIYKQSITNVTRKWQNANGFLAGADYKSDATKPMEEQAYFKMMGEQTAEDPNYINRIQGDKLLAVSLSGRSAQAKVHDKEGNIANTPSEGYKKDGRQMRVSPISYLTADEASMNVNNKTYPSYKFYDSTMTAAPACGPEKQADINRKRGKNGHHISEITVTERDGKRAVYGLPVYNLQQDEYTFAVNPALKDAQADKTNLIGAELDNNNEIKHNYGKDQYYHHETQPGYASSYLLTAILSPDYVDLTNNGITDDDLGTAVKFNYSKVASDYCWRTPMSPGKALFNRGLNADIDDDKGSIVSGRKELWYLNSIETKTKIAYFITADREDGLGTSGSVMGYVNSGVKQRRLKEIRLYSKSDLSQPIKTAYFNYDYTLCPGIPNSVNGGGKLTLKSVYFTYGSSKKGAHHPYTFEYANNKSFGYMASDRWGTYAPDSASKKAGFAMKNDEFPYTVQDTAQANSNARLWNLSKITLPTGGSINVEYESGDYAYVQDRRAMQMVGLLDLVKDTSGTVTTNLRDAQGIRITAPGPLRGVNDAGILDNFVTDYLNGRNDCYVKMNVNVTDRPAITADSYYDNVSCYGEVAKVRNNKNGTYDLIFKNVTQGGVTVNPLVMAAWQKMRLEYPKYAYPGYEDRIRNATGIERALNAIVNAIGNISELRKNFNERARDNDFAININKGKSFTRIVKGDGIKLGGSARVKRVRMSDDWNNMSGKLAPGATYGQEYEYRTTVNGGTISSGVASYEPAIGADENPMRMPVPYSQESKGTLTNYFYLEEPFGESLFPAPQIGYSKVTVRDLDATGKADAQKATGWLQHEFYTARDYPVIVAAQSRPDVSQNGPAGWANFSGANQVYELAMSQGYVIWLNDMHGKPKAQRVFNQSGNEISSTVYYYKSDPLDADKLKLNNSVTTVDEKGNINPSEILGREIEMVTDMREQETKDVGLTVQAGVDVIPLLLYVVAIPHWPRRDNDSYRLFRSASILKTVQQTGILSSVVKTINGSTVTSDNLVFDRNTGQPVVTRTNNEFNDPVYSVNMPAYWKYEKISGAYKNLNTVFPAFTTDANGVVLGSYASFITGGDEMMDVTPGSNTPGKRYWVIRSATTGDATLRLRVIDDAGLLVKNMARQVKLYRSGFRNQFDGVAGTVVSMKNPVAGGKIAIFDTVDNTAYKVLDAKAVLYEEEWGAKLCATCPFGFSVSTDGTRCERYAVENANDTLQLVPIVSSKTDIGINGASFKLANNSVVTKKNYYWGGDCSGGGTSSLMARSVGVQNQSLLVSGSCGRLYWTGVWLNKSQGVTDTWMGMETCFTATTSGTYSLGYGVDDLMRIFIDNVQIVNTPAPGSYWSTWTVIPVSMTAGKHTIRVEFLNSYMAGGTETTNPGIAGVEVYNQSPDVLYGLSDASANTIFSTGNMVYPNNSVNTYVLDANNVRRIARYDCIENLCNVPFVCESRPINGPLNPYLAGFLGNWRVSEEKAYEVNRVDQQIFANKGAGLNLRSSGYFNGFKSYWYYDAANARWSAVPANDKWVTSRYVTLYDQYGQEMENKDALLRYSSASFGYRGAVPVAVAGNAMRREIFYDGFEDYNYNGLCGAVSCNMDSFDIRNTLGVNYISMLKSDDAHSGNFSLKLTLPLTLSAKVHTLEHQPGDGKYLDKDAFGQYITKLTKGLYPQGFQPQPSKKYIFSAWVKDGSVGNTIPNITPSVNGTNLNLTFKAVVEGWKLVEAEIDLPANATDLKLIIPASASAAIDDIRLFPYNATIKTYAYDDKTLRLMAEMDENNFATFYEYDDEGTLIRVKKETDLGIMTLKESRSVYRKMN